jgi:hypothetical protein
MREALRGLTGRGRAFLYGAGAAALCALLFGEKDFLRVAILLAILPLLAAWTVGRSRYRLACSRALEPNRVQVGMTARVLLRLENLSAFATGTMLLEDRLPYALGGVHGPGRCSRPVRGRAAGGSPDRPVRAV